MGVGFTATGHGSFSRLFALSQFPHRDFPLAMEIIKVNDGSPPRQVKTSGQVCSGKVPFLFPRRLSSAAFQSRQSPAMSDTNTLYFLLKGDEQSGPFTIGQLRSMWQSGSITAQTQYWFEGAPEWRPLINILRLLEPESALTKPTTSPLQRPPSIRIVPSRRPITVNVQDIWLKNAVIILCCLAVFLAVIGSVIWALESSKQEAAKREEELAKHEKFIHDIKMENAAIEAKTEASRINREGR